MKNDFKSPYHDEFKYAKIFQKLDFYSRKTENVQIFLNSICAKELCKISSQKNVQSAFFCSRLSKKKIKSQNPKTTSRYKYRFSRVKEK